MLVELRRAALAMLALGGCVNSYVVDRDSAGSSDDAGTSTAATGSSSGPTGGGTGGATTGEPPVDCQPCGSDAQCGGPSDRCVDVLEVGPVCMGPCSELGCADGFDCTLQTSVDGEDQEVCQPRACVVN